MQGAAREISAVKKQSIAVRTIDSTQEALASMTPELVIALCGPIGSPLHETAGHVCKLIEEFSYHAEIIRLSEIIRLNMPLVAASVDSHSRHAEIDSLIRGGDALRERYGNDILAKMAIAKIGADRTFHYGEFDDTPAEGLAADARKIASHRICHIIDSIKNSDELTLLRNIYGDALFAIGVFSPVETRKMNLEHSEELSASDIELLIDTDSGEEFSHGQSVRDTFPLCDYFLRVDDGVNGPQGINARSQIETSLQRLLSLLFRTAVVSPTLEESAMYAAASAARNSACLSRQVGASVTSSNGELLAIGWNDVPNSGGGLYGKLAVNGHKNPDARCYAKKGVKCHNDAEKRAIAGMIVSNLVSDKIIPQKKQWQAVEAMIKNTRLKDLIEFSRAVHAEMHAILTASRVAGERIVGGKIFVTTYPCHACARHIIAAGLQEVYYIEPYRKSLATRLHDDAMTEAQAAGDRRVRLIQFDGVAPRRYLDLFDSGSRKAAGGVLKLSAKEIALPATNVSLRAIPRLEEVVVAEVKEKAFRFPKVIAPEGEQHE
ncbi:CMP deaminase [Pluralibacter gergoviae]|uniref:anti-phage dCTP deaminase n=1 Tax=Pluralibacter gergoviae TaxID=61647 RepID=UPI0004F87F42|nr:anti-phage dCTP deaminase [Pluralibacter gergoviae]AIR03008.1 CMP deaminase [Pluralibacter gergoviae]KJM57312.1 CMP deaminase [Pluralibacter gergoviae]KMK10251.1 CMP deaminase [Pluralibacter gergoviae]OUQ95121.1 CMP deaminase [Pluralibacter gergoviae]